MPAKKSIKSNASKKTAVKKTTNRRIKTTARQKQAKKTTKTKSKSAKAKKIRKRTSGDIKALKKDLPKPKKLTLNYMNLIQFLLEFIVASGFFFGIFGYNYNDLSWCYVLPLTLVNFIISVIENNKTITYSAITMVMALIALYPTVGLFAKLVGIGLSISSITILSGKLHE